MIPKIYLVSYGIANYATISDEYRALSHIVQ